jgi:hypothetical protein
MKRPVGVMALALVAIVGLSCGRDPVGPLPGVLSVKLTTPNSGADSAIVFTISGPAAVTSVTAGVGMRLFPQALGGTSTRFALVGRLTQDAVVLTIGVEDVHAVGQYSGTIQGVAQADYQLRTPLALASYALDIVR